MQNWSCQNCGETIEESFDVCWKCGTDRYGKIDPNFALEKQELSISESDTDAAAEPYDSEGFDGPENNNEFLEIENLIRKVLWDYPHVIRDWICSRSVVTIAVITQLVCWALAPKPEYCWQFASDMRVQMLFGAALFLPSAIKQWNWRLFIGMSLFALIAPSIATWISSLLELQYLPVIHEIARPSTIMALVATGHWLFSPGDRWQELLWTIACVTSAAAVYSMVQFFFFWTGTYQSTAIYFLSALMAILTWLAISLGERSADSGKKPSHLFTAFGILILVSVYIYTFHIGIYRIARASLESEMHLDKKFAVQLLNRQGGRKNHEAIADALEDADWVNIVDSGFQLSIDEPWRETAVKLMVIHDKSWAAERLSFLLIKNPNRAILDMTDGLFVECKRHETAAIYIRFALLDSINPFILPFGSSKEKSGLDYRPYVLTTLGMNRYKLELEEMGVPHVALAWIYDVATLHGVHNLIRLSRSEETPTKEDKRIVVSKSLRQRLKQMLGSDAGEGLKDWELLYHEEIDDVYSPLNEAEREEVGRVIACFENYLAAKAELLESLPEEDWSSIEEPDWHVPTTEALEEEIDKYNDQLEKVVNPFKLL